VGRLPFESDAPFRPLANTTLPLPRLLPRCDPRAQHELVKLHTRWPPYSSERQKGNHQTDNNTRIGEHQTHRRTFVSPPTAQMSSYARAPTHAFAQRVYSEVVTLTPKRQGALSTSTSPKRPSVLFTSVAPLPAGAAETALTTRPTPRATRSTTALAALLFTCMDGQRTGQYMGNMGSTGPYRREQSNMGQYGAARGSKVEMGAVQAGVVRICFLGLNGKRIHRCFVSDCGCLRQLRYG